MARSHLLDIPNVEVCLLWDVLLTADSGEADVNKSKVLHLVMET
jgi:hypothetical protein